MINNMNKKAFSYQLTIELKQTVTIIIGKPGKFEFSTGKYIYTGSAKRNMEARINRHLSKNKKMKWHIDYLLAHHQAHIIKVERFSIEECLLNQKTNGSILIPGFGASDCKKGCKSHLKYIGS